MSLLDEMKSLNVSMPDLISYNAAIAACEADALAAGAALLDEMQDRGIVPDVIRVGRDLGVREGRAVAAGAHRAQRCATAASSPT